jgi:hypothetical protein
LEVARYFEHETALPWQIGEYGHVYTGQSAEGETRLRQHLFGAADVSTFRKTLLAVEEVYGAISRSETGVWAGDSQEEALSQWLADNAVVGWLTTDQPRELERAILAIEPSPFNIEGRRRSSYAAHLMGLRRSVYGTARDRMLHRNAMLASLTAPNYGVKGDSMCQNGTRGIR